MRTILPLWGLLLSVLALPSLAHIRPRAPQPRSYHTHTYYSLELDPATSYAAASDISSSLGVELVEPIGELEGYWLVRTPTGLEKRGEHDPVLRRWSALPASVGKRSLTQLEVRQRAKRHRSYPARYPHPREDATELFYAQKELHLNDPMLDQQWHLINLEMKDIELNVTGVWGRGITGEGVHVVIVDDGLDMESDDLKANFFPEGSYDFNDHTELPAPRLSDDQHGTRCAGEIAAVPNDVCGVGVSYGAKIAGVRILSAPISDADEAAALNYAYQLNDIFSCSWGPPDDGKSMEAPEGMILKAMVNGVQKGRDGKGSVFVFAAGNGGGVDDQCNFDGYTNSIFSVTVGAVDRKGLHPYYSEMCAAMMTVAPSSGSGDHIHTTDVGKDKCAHSHGGTSAAAPLAAGVFALALSVRPDLTWRDIQHITIRNSVYFNPDDPDWETTAAGRKFSYKYGYGRLDAGRFVEGAEAWKVVKPQAWYDSPAVYLPTTSPADVTRRQPQDADAPADAPADSDAGNANPDDTDDTDDIDDSEDGTPTPNPEPVVEPTGSFITESGITSTYEVTQAMLDDANFETLEHITVRVWIDHQRRGDVEVEVKSPNGVTSVLSRQRRYDEADTGFAGWKFMSLKHWEENPVGTWTIKVKDQINPDKTGRFVAWSLQLWGESVDPALARLWAPAEEGMPDEEQTGSDPTSVISQKPKPTQLLPGDHGEASGEADKPGLGSATAPPAPTATGTEDEDVAEPTGATDAAADEGFFSGITTLASSSTWLAGAGMIIVLAGAGIGAFFYFRSRSRRRSRNLFGLANDGAGGRGAYEPVEEVQMGLLERGRRKFGGGVDERTGLRYHDDFLEDDAPHPTGEIHETEYKDEPEEEEGKEGKGKGKGKERQREGEGETASGSSGSGSWQDAAEEASEGRV
ncbi:hypothetical protein IAT38_000912 [Cryptococcus sp. DSM 104549]